MMGMMGSCMAGMGLFWLVGVLGLLGIGIGAALLLRRTTVVPALTGQSRSTGDDAALAMLRERFARGEIDRTEYEERRRALLADEPHWA